MIGTATTAPAMPAMAAPTASTRMMARGWIRTIRPTTSGWRRWLSSWFSRMKMATSTSAATQPLVPSVTATASVPATRMPTSGTNAARKTRMTSGASSGTSITHKVMPMTTAWMAATGRPCPARHGRAVAVRPQAVVRGAGGLAALVPAARPSQSRHYVPM